MSTHTRSTSIISYLLVQCNHDPKIKKIKKRIVKHFCQVCEMVDLPYRQVDFVILQMIINKTV